MTTRITKANLEAVVARINRMTGSPIESYKMIEGKYVAQLGNYHLDGAYGKVALHRMETEGGGISEVISRDTKSGLYQRMFDFIKGYEMKTERTR